MNFQAKLRKEFMLFFIKLIFVMVLLFAGVTVFVNIVNNNTNKNHSIEFVNDSFRELTDTIATQIRLHNEDPDFIQAVLDHHVSRKLVSSTDYSFSQAINIRYSYDIYDMEATPVYQESYHLLPQYKIYLNIIKDRIRNNSPVTFILYPSFKTHTSTLICYGGLYNGEELIGFDMYSIEINDLDYALLPNTGDYVITDRFDGVIATNNRDLLENNMNFIYAKNYESNALDYNITKVSKGFYSIYYLEEKIHLSSTYVIAFSLSLAIALIVMAFASSIIRRIATENTKSFESIIADTNTVSMGNLDHRINDALEDDFHSLAVNINEMLDKLNYEITLNKDLSETNVIFEQRKLDAQFNPHFLYNSLETIRYSMQYDMKGAEKYILDLTSILRYSISNNINYSTMEDDLTYTRKYLELYKYRFADKLTYSISISDEVKHVSIPKLALNPLVSNSIKYGFANALQVDIAITSEMIDTSCYIRVRDNGTSITDAVISEINQICRQQKNPTNHIGVHNVLRRFVILYPDTVLNVRRDEDGTVFEIHFTPEAAAHV